MNIFLAFLILQIPAVPVTDSPGERLCALRVRKRCFIHYLVITSNQQELPETSLLLQAALSAQAPPGP